MRVRPIHLRLAILSAVLLVVVILAFPHWQRARISSFVRNADRVELVLQGPAPLREHSVIITDPAAIQRLVSDFRLASKTPCRCLHMESAVFWQGRRSLRAFICGHCFDVRLGPLQYYLSAMPEKFYAQFRELTSPLRDQTRPASAAPAPR